MLHLDDDGEAAQPDWRRYEPGLRRYLRKRVPTAQVDDLLQEIWVRLYSLRDPSAVRHIDRYMFVVASSVLSLHHRRNRNEASVDAAHGMPEQADDISPERSLAGKERVTRVLNVLDGLPPRTRQIFLLHRFEEMTYQRIAREIGISVSAVEKHMIKALKALLSSEAADR